MLSQQALVAKTLAYMVERVEVRQEVDVAQALPSLLAEPPVLVDWLPWNHTFGGNHDFGMVLHNGGSFYIDAGKPVPGPGFEPTVKNLRDIAPTIYFNVPKGYDMMLPALEADAGLAGRFFEKLRMVFYAGAGMPPGGMY